MIKANISILFLSIFALFSCNTRPEPIKLGVDLCSFCKMNIADNHFGAEIVSNDGEIFKFDDMHCLTTFLKENNLTKNNIKAMYSANFCGNHDLIKADENLLLYKSDLLHSPMNGNIAAFDNRDSLAAVRTKFEGGMPLNWDELIKCNFK